MGKVEITTSWTQVVVQGDYRKPQVFCGVPSKAGGDAVACRIAGMRHTVQGTKLVLRATSSESQAEWQSAIAKAIPQITVYEAQAAATDAGALPQRRADPPPRPARYAGR